ncbi:nb-arc domain-containing protein [Citrus sinensis]|uniref:Nb-arc domain-containing protein n=1 Tax=Citrus sinensis TaxID=2711 RepID=A0ACB8KK41_CITSI|nr:nb-arc domain-containing protein [Citrus sinensis]
MEIVTSLSLITFEKLKNDVDKLKNARDSVQYKVDDSKIKGDGIQQHVEEWLISVDEVISEVRKLTEVEEKSNNQCFNGLCPNLKTHYQLIKKAEREVNAIVGLHEKRKFDSVSFRTIPEEIWLKSTEGFIHFESRKSTLKEILGSLSNHNFNMIGVYGMGGIGKTMLVKEVAGQAKGNNLFEKAVGIPLADDNSRCKVLLTARSLDVLSCKMDCQHNSFIDILNKKEAWSLFKKMAGDCIENSELKSVATDIVKECAGLPIAIVPVAKALKNKSLYEWRNALRQLQRPFLISFSGTQAVAYSTVELSYNHLEGRELKETLLLIGYSFICCVEDLLCYGMGLALFQNINTLEEARDRALTLVDKLKNPCLLLDGVTSEWFAMHDVVRDVAISIVLMRDSGSPRSTTRISARSTSPRPGGLLVMLLLQMSLHKQTSQSMPVVPPAQTLRRSNGMGLQLLRYGQTWDLACYATVQGKAWLSWLCETLRVTPRFWGKRGCHGSVRSCVLRHGSGESVAVVPRFSCWRARLANCRRPGLLAS